MGRKRVLVFSCLFFGLASLRRLCPDAEYAHILALSHRAGSWRGNAQCHHAGLRICPKRCRAMAINTMYCGFPLGLQAAA
jgi:AAHS family 4-hydroxybenzoate transporter-like MFS transporter